MLRILVVDDDPGTVAFLEGLLKGEGHMVQTDSDGEGALAKAKAMVPDVLLTDLEMPGKTGNQLIAAMRADERLREAYFVVLTTHGGKKEKMKSLLSGADDFIVKPGVPGEILGRLEIAGRVLKERKEARMQARLAARPDPASLAALDAVLLRAIGLLGEAERELSSPQPDGARKALGEARGALAKAVDALRKGPAK